MAITKAKKEEILRELDEVIKSAKSITFAKFDGLSVVDTTDMRNKLREEGVGYRVAKKTLLAIAMKKAGFEGEMPELPGNIAIAYSTDATAPAREVLGMKKGFKDKIAIVGGVFNGIFKNEQEMNEIAMIPSLQVLRGMFVNVINSPIQGLVVALNAIAEKRQ